MHLYPGHFLIQLYSTVHVYKRGDYHILYCNFNIGADVSHCINLATMKLRTTVL